MHRVGQNRDTACMGWNIIGGGSTWAGIELGDGMHAWGEIEWGEGVHGLG